MQRTPESVTPFASQKLRRFPVPLICDVRRLIDLLWFIFESQAFEMQMHSSTLFVKAGTCTKG